MRQNFPPLRSWLGSKALSNSGFDGAVHAFYKAIGARVVGRDVPLNDTLRAAIPSELPFELAALVRSHRSRVAIPPHNLFLKEAGCLARVNRRDASHLNKFRKCAGTHYARGGAIRRRRRKPDNAVEAPHYQRAIAFLRRKKVRRWLELGALNLGRELVLCDEYAIRVQPLPVVPGSHKGV